MVHCGLPSVSLLPFIYCCPSSLVIWHTLNKLPFASDSTLIMKPLLSFWFNCCLEMFIILFLISSTAASGFSGSTFKNSFTTILFWDYHTIINTDTISSIQHVPICQKLTYLKRGIFSPKCWPLLSQKVDM